MFLSCHIAYADEAFSENQKNQIEKIIHSYLLKKPEILVESAKELKKKIDMEQNQFQVIDAIDQKKIILDTGNVPTIGNPNANLTITYFFDYQCAHCHKTTPELEKIIAKYSKNVLFIFRDWPVFSSQWESSKIASTTGLDIYNNYGSDAYYSYFKEVFNTKLANGNLKQKNINEIVEKLNLKPTQGKKNYKEILDKNAEISEKLRLHGTPSFIIMPTKNISQENTYIITGNLTFDKLDSIIKYNK